MPASRKVGVPMSRAASTATPAPPSMPSHGVRWSLAASSTVCGGPTPEEGLGAEGDLARVTADDVPGEPHGRPQEHEREDAVVVALAERQGEHEPDRDHPRDAEPAAGAGHA